MPTPTPPWTIRYNDGSANGYRIAGSGDFKYSPVTKEQSSTGMYSGGDPRQGRLDAGKLEALWQEVAKLEANPAIHTDDRGKGTGAFVIDDANGSRELIIALGPEIRAFDAFLKTLP